jgi:hypothetical protein
MVAAPYSQTRGSGSGARLSALGPASRPDQALILQCSIPFAVAHAEYSREQGTISLRNTAICAIQATFRADVFARVMG